MEVWKDAKHYEYYYQVSNKGQIKSFERVDRLGRVRQAKFKALRSDKDGYQITNLCLDGYNTTWKVHRLVAEAFIPNPLNLPCVNHINGVKTDNRVENLEWCTHSYNRQHAYNSGLSARGEDCSFAKLNESQVRDIYRQVKLGGSQRLIAKVFGVHEVTVSNLVNGRTWKHLNLTKLHKV